MVFQNISFQKHNLVHVSMHRIGSCIYYTIVVFIAVPSHGQVIKYYTTVSTNDPLQTMVI